MGKNSDFGHTGSTSTPSLVVPRRCPSILPRRKRTGERETEREKRREKRRVPSSTAHRSSWALPVPTFFALSPPGGGIVHAHLERPSKVERESLGADPLGVRERTSVLRTPG